MLGIHTEIKLPMNQLYNYSEEKKREGGERMNLFTLSPSTLILEIKCPLISNSFTDHSSLKIKLLEFKGPLNIQILKKKITLYIFKILKKLNLY